jgi:hypothetical protein
VCPSRDSISGGKPSHLCLRRKCRKRCVLCGGKGGKKKGVSKTVSPRDG